MCVRCVCKGDKGSRGVGRGMREGISEFTGGKYDSSRSLGAPLGPDF